MHRESCGGSLLAPSSALTPAGQFPPVPAATMSSNENINVPGYLVVLWLFLIVFIIFIIRHYACRPEFPWHSYPVIFLAYFCSLGVLLILPLDVSTAVISRRSISNEEDFDDNSRTLRRMYTCFFIIMQILGGVVMVIQEAMYRDGHFTIFTQFISALRAIALQSLAGLVLFFILFGILIGEGVVDASADAVLLTVVVMSNTFGLFALMLLLGYGLVSFPQMLWLRGDIKRQLNLAQQKAASRFKDLAEISLNMSMAVSNVMKTQQDLKSSTNLSPEMSRAIQICVQECPPEFTSARMGKVALDKKTGKVTLESLAQLRGEVIALKGSFKMCQGKVEEAKRNAYYYEDILEAMNNKSEKIIKWSLAPPSTEWDYNWHVTIKPLLFRVCAVFAAILSIFSYLGIIGTMNGVGPGVSVYFLAVHDDRGSASGICVFVLFTLAHAVFTIVWSVFQMKISNLMELLPGQTTPSSLSVNARVCANLSSPLAFFYLGWIYENGLRRGPWTEGATGGTAGEGSKNEIFTAFSKFYQIDIIPVMKGGFNTIFPVVVFIVSGLVLFNLFNIILVKLKLERYQFGAEILTDEQLREGVRQLTRHKNTMVRAYSRKALREQIDGKPTASSWKPKFFSSEEEPDKKVLTASVDSARPTISEPPDLSGWVEKKGNKTLGVAGGGWQNRFMVVRKPGNLFYYKDEDVTQEPSGQIDLTLVVNFTLKEKDESEKASSAGTVRLDLDLADRVLKLRFKTPEEASRWKEGLTIWKDYANDNGMYFPSAGVIDPDGAGDDDDIESGRLSVNKKRQARLSDVDIGIQDTDETTALAPNKQQTTVSSPFTFGRSSNARKGEEKDLAPSPPRPVSQTVLSSPTLSDSPPPLEGWLEKKQNGKLGKWQRRYFRVLEKSNELAYYKTDNPSENPAGTVDLKMISEVSVAEKEAKTDAARFNIDSGDRILKLRATSTAEGVRWINELNAWREHALLSFT